MLKRLVILLLEFGAGLAGNLAAGWIQQDAWSNLFTLPRLLGTLASALIMLALLAWLESERALPWNWRWHRFWYLRELLENPDLHRWEADFARLELAQGRRKVSGTVVIADGERRDLIEVLRDLIAGRQGEVCRSLVLGEPGSGKTTGLERLTLELAREGAKRMGFGHSMPVLVRLGNFQKGELLDYVGQAMQHGTWGRSGKVLGRGIEELVEQGRVVLLFDALDEALGERREIVLAEQASFLESRACERVPVVIASRTQEDPGGRLKGLPVFEIQDLSDEAVGVFIRAYKQPEHNEGEIRERLQRHRLLEPGGLGRNPFWLRLIVENGAFEGNKGQILNQAVDALLAREWDEKPDAKRSWRRVLSREAQLHETKRALAWLGYRMSVANQIEFAEDRALTELRDWLTKRADVGDLGPRDVLGLGRDAQVLVYDPGPVLFRHRLLQEFMTAWALTVEERLLTHHFLEQCVQDTDWWETLLMLGGLVKDHTALAQNVLGDGSDAQRLFLAVGLLRSVDEPDGELEHRVTEALVENLRRGVTLEHKNAVVRLARIAGEGVLEALDRLLQEDDPAVRASAKDLLKVAFYQRAEILDRLKHIDNPSQREVEQVVGIIRSPSYHKYFFHNLNKPGWVKPLKTAGVFDEPPRPTETEKGLYTIPPWEASQYLVRVASDQPNLVAEIARQIKTENFRIHQDLLQAAMNMPPDIAAQMVPAIIEWQGNLFSSLIPQHTAELMAYLANGGQWNGALELLINLTEPVVESLLTPEVEGASVIWQPEAKPRYDGFTFGEILGKQVLELTQIRPFSVSTILENQLIKAIECEREAKGRTGDEDNSISWRSAIEDDPQDRHHRDMKALLTTALRNALEEAARRDPGESRNILERYLEHRYSIFRRLAIHLVRLHTDNYHEFAVRLLDRKENLRDRDIYHEFYLLMEATFDKVPRDVQQRLLDRIMEGEPPESLERGKRLWALRDHDLPIEYRTRRDAMVAELGEPEYPSFLRYTTPATRFSLIRYPSPKSKDELVAMTPEEVLDYIEGYDPPTEEFQPSPEGLGRVLSEVVQEEPEGYAAIAPRFSEPGVRPVYMYYLLEGLEDAWKRGKSFDWEPVLAFCAEAVRRVDEDNHSRTHHQTTYKTVHLQVVSLLQEAVRRDDHAVPMECLSGMRDILLELLHHPDPTVESEQSSYGSASMDPATLSLNTVRGKAMHTLIVYALHRARLLDNQTERKEEALAEPRLEPKVRAALTGKLDKTKDPSWAVHATFGQYLPNLNYLGQDWVTQHLPQIFPAEADKQAYWQAAWDSYVSFNRLYNDLYRALRREYRRAIDQLPERAEARAGLERVSEQLAGHLMIAYWRGLEELEGDESILSWFFQNAPDNIRAHAVWFLGSGLREVKPSANSEVWQRLRKLWEMRIATVKQAPDPSAFRQELSFFAVWLENVPKPENLDSLYPLVEAIVPHLEKSMHTLKVTEYLAAQAEAHPALAARLLLQIIEQEKQPSYRGQEETYTILEAAMRSGDQEARSCAEVAINLLGERGQYKYRDLLKE